MRSASRRSCVGTDCMAPEIGISADESAAAGR